MSKKPNNNTLIGVIVLIVIVVLLAIIGPKNDKKDTNNSPDTSKTTTDNNTVKDEENNIVTNNKTNFNYILPSEWDGLKRAEKDIQSLGEGQKITPGIVEDPTDSNIVYFASSNFDKDKNENLVSIYKYRKDDYNFERIYKKTFSATTEFKPLSNDLNIKEDPFIPRFHVSAYDSGSLIIKIEHNDSYIDDCGALFVSTPDIHYISLDISNPYSSFGEVTIPKEVWRLDSARAVQCSGQKQH